MLTADPSKVKLRCQGFTALGGAASKGFDEIVELLLSYNADIEAKDDDGDTPLKLAVSNNHVSTCSILLQRGSNSNRVNKDGWFPLLLASKKNNYEICELLISHNADVNQAHGFTPLHEASVRGHFRIVTL